MPSSSLCIAPRLAPFALALAAFICVRPVCSAQAVSAPGDAQTDDQEEEIVVLSPFSVNAEKDRGYLAADTLTGGRMATNLLTTPGDITVQTREFLNDIAANTLTDAYKWMPNATVADPPGVSGSAIDSGQTFTFRGLPSGGNARNYFAGYNFSVNDFVVERIEQIRGPASILYGQSWSGGAVNIVTKRPIFGKNDVRLGIKGDAEGTQGVSIDANYGRSKYLALRVNATDQRLRNWVSTYFDDLTAVDLSATVRPWKGAEIRIEGETGVREMTGQPGPFVLMDAVSAWDGRTIYEGRQADDYSTLVPDSGTSLIQPAQAHMIYSPVLGGKVLDFSYFATTYGTGMSVVDRSNYYSNRMPVLMNMPTLPSKGFSPQPTNNKYVNHYSSLQAFWSQTWDNGLALELSASFNEISRTTPNAGQSLWGNMKLDINRYLPDGANNPGFMKYFSDTTIEGGNVDNYQNDAQVRLNALYPIKFGWGRQTFAVMLQNDLQSYRWRAHAYARLNNGNPYSTSNLVSFRQYWDNPNLPLVLPSTDAEGNPYGWSPSAHRDQSTKLQSIQVGTVGSYFDDRFTVIAGARRDVYHYSENNHNIVNGVIAGDRITSFSRSANTASIGATYFPVKALGALVNYSGGFQPNTITYPFFPGFKGDYVTTSKVLTLGIRFNLFKGAVVGSLGYYASKEQNRVQRYDSLNIRSIWENMGELERYPFQGYTAYSDTFDQEGSGLELDLVANPTKNLRLTANFSIPRTKQSNSMPGSRAYLAEHEPEWRAWMQAHPNDAWRVEQQLSSWINTVSDSVNGRTLNGTFDYRANFYGVYTFSKGILKGFRIGGGGNLYGRRVIGNVLGDGKNYIKADAYAVYTLMTAYAFKLGRTSVYIQVNIDNLFNYDKPVFNNVQLTGGRTPWNTPETANTAYPFGYYYNNPRMLRLGMTVSF
ncbi:TonB-dependent siderophore receptor [Termitidicoccus mucosus]|uniref:TonB-dependent siderophore receptor n=1 Tax=Termitidicoccus mucosus TaxID=1184151 RepID=UPI0011AB52F8